MIEANFKMYFILFISSIFGLVLGEAIFPSCPDKEEYRSCGTRCPETCQPAATIICSDLCVKGCFCKKGYIRNVTNNECMESTNCPYLSRCGENEEYLECGTACPLTCESSGPQVCADTCIETCACVEGYLRSRLGGPCVLDVECQTIFAK